MMRRVPLIVGGRRKPGPMTAEAWLPTRRHPVAEVVERLHRELDAVADAITWSMSAEEAGAALVQLTRLDARVAGLRLRLAAEADRRDVGGAVGATSTASWWAHETRMTRAAAHREMRLARALESEHEPVRAALGRGDLLLDQAQVVVDSVDALPTDLAEEDVVARAEARLVELAADHDAKQLRILGRRVLDLVAPDAGEAHERRQLEREERDAAAHTRFTLVDDGHGLSHGRFRIPTVQADMLRKQLMAIAAPRHQAASAAGDRARGVLPDRLGRAFAEYVERYPADRLPSAGGVAATVVVTMTVE